MYFLLKKFCLVTPIVNTMKFFFLLHPCRARRGLLNCSPKGTSCNQQKVSLLLAGGYMKYYNTCNLWTSKCCFSKMGAVHQDQRQTKVGIKDIHWGVSTTDLFRMDRGHFSFKLFSVFWQRKWHIIQVWSMHLSAENCRPNTTKMHQIFFFFLRGGPCEPPCRMEPLAPYL